MIMRIQQLHPYVDLTTMYLSICKEHSHKIAHYFSHKKTLWGSLFLLSKAFSLSCFLLFFFYGVLWMLAHGPIYRRSKSKLPYMHEDTCHLAFMQATKCPLQCMHHNMRHSYTTPCVTHTLRHVHTMHLATCHHMQPSILSNICWPYGNGWTPHFSHSSHRGMPWLVWGCCQTNILFAKLYFLFRWRFCHHVCSILIGVNFLYFQQFTLQHITN